jgi:hypothetical protein
MFQLPRSSKSAFALIAFAAFLSSCISLTAPAYAGTTGNITGVVTDTSGKPVADVKVTAASPSQTASTTTDGRGFYTLLNLNPDTYTVSFQKAGYADVAQPGIVVYQDQTVRANQTMTPQLKTIASVTSRGPSNLVQPNQGSDVYNVSEQQISAATNPVGALSTIYNFLAVTPGVTSTIGSQPRIRGGQVTDLGYEFEGIPIQDDIVGFFTSNLSNVGLQNVEVYTGGLAGAGAVHGTGYFNSVLKSGTYPGFASLGIQASSPEANQYLSFEDGGATPDHKYSWYIAFNGVNSQNQYDYGEYTFPGVVFCCDGPGTVKERNWVGNFFYRPDPKNTFQIVATNDDGDFDFNYLLTRSPGQPTPLALSECPGAVSSWTGGQFPNAGFPSTGTFATGGTAPNGQPCPIGLYYSALGSGQGNIWHHLGGLGKIQWNHNLNDHSFFNLRVDENFNQYIFDQPMSDPNIPSLENPGDPYNWAAAIGLPGGCPNYPYTPGTPVQNPAGDPYDQCVWFDGTQSFWGNRRSNIWQAAIDYTNALSDNVTLKAGLSDQYNNNTFDYVATDNFTIVPNGTPSGGLLYPGMYEQSNYPTTEQIGYFDPEFHFGKVMVSPGITYAQRHYAFPADYGYVGDTRTVNGQPVTASDIYSGGYTAKAWDPTINGTYTFDPNNVLTFSYGDTTNFIATAYVYNNSLAQYSGFDAGHSYRDPFIPGTTFAPQQNHAAELMWEHNFGDGITMRVGPFHNSTNNYYAEYNPLLGYFNSGCSANSISTCTPCSAGTAGCVPVQSKSTLLSNNNATEETGVEFGLNRIDNAPRGTSFWLSATYDNYWDTSGDISGAYINFPLPQYLIDQGVKVRAASNPLWNVTALMDYHSNGFHFDPIFSYQGDTFFNTGVVSQPTDSNGNPTGPPYISQPEQIAHGWWTANLMAYKEFGGTRGFTVGFNVQNIFDNVTPIYPCYSGGNGCYPFNGPQSGVSNQTGLIYQNFSQTPRTFYFFAGIKM